MFKLLAFRGSVGCFRVFVRPAARRDPSVAGISRCSCNTDEYIRGSKGALSMLLFTNISPLGLRFLRFNNSLVEGKRKKAIQRSTAVHFKMHLLCGR